MAEPTCGKCGSAMTAGVFATKDSNGARAAAHWLEGQAELGIWSGLKTGGRLLLPVAAHCCQNCGFVEMYALPPTTSDTAS